MSFVDEAYSGMYTYDPTVFMSGKNFKIEIYDASEPGRVHKSITVDGASKFIKQLRSDFEGVIEK